MVKRGPFPFNDSGANIASERALLGRQGACCADDQGARETVRNAERDGGQLGCESLDRSLTSFA